MLLFYCDLISCTTPACFSTFYQCAMIPTLVENFDFLCTCVTFPFQSDSPDANTSVTTAFVLYACLKDSIMVRQQVTL